MLEDQARDVRVVAGQNQLRKLSAHRHHRPHEEFQHVGVVDADLQHHAARHAGGLVAPGREIDLAQPVAADVRLGIDQLAEHAGIDLLLHPAEVALAPALIAERQHDAGLAAHLADRAPVGDRVRDRLVEEHMLARRRGGACGLEMHVVRRRVDDRVDRRIGQHLFVARRRPALVFGGKGGALVGRARIARRDLDPVRARHGVGQHVRPPTHADASHAKRFVCHICYSPSLTSYFQVAPIASTASRAMRSSVAQSPPLTPMPPIHSPPMSTGAPPSIAVQRSGPAASASPSA